MAVTDFGGRDGVALVVGGSGGIGLAITRLLAQRANADGGWGWTANSESDVDSTALAVQADVREVGGALH